MIKLLKELIIIFMSNSYNKQQLYCKAIFDSLKDKGGVYNKMLQILCITKKFTEGWMLPKDFMVYNQVNSEKIDIKMLISNIDKFSYIEKEPIASGSFAQVYKGILNNGETVAIKVIKPSIYNNLHKDLKKIKKIVKVGSLFLKKSIIDIMEAYQEFQKTCIVEMDYEQEIANMNYFYKIYKNNNNVKIPKVYEDLSNKYMIVQEFIEGPTLADLIQSLKPEENIYQKNRELTGSDLWQQLIIVGGESIKGALKDDYLYGDAHPGNIILLPNNKIAFIDFGIVASSPVSHEAFYRFTKSYSDVINNKGSFKQFMEDSCKCFFPDLSNALRNSGYNVVDAISSSFDNKLSFYENKIDDVKDLKDGGHLLMVFTELLDKKNLLNLQIDLRNYSLLKAIQAVICSMNAIDKKFAPGIYKYLINESMNYAFSNVLVEDIPKDYSTRTKYSLGDSFAIIDQILSNIANNDEFLFNSIYERI